MPLFKCSKCGCVDNTALGNYWGLYACDGKPPLCSECDTGVWHGRFPKKPHDPATEPLEANGYKLRSKP